jgi:hypothetical protein
MSGRPDTPLEAMLRAGGIVHPQYTNEQSDATRLSLAYCCAMLELETAGGNNEFGHDPGNPIRGGQVTRSTYEAYRVYVARGYRPQGVGPCQLTDLALQDQADRLGGCWQVPVNMCVGFRFLAALIGAHGEEAGFAAYNGSGAAARLYGEHAMQLAGVWQQRINAVEA